MPFVTAADVQVNFPFDPYPCQVTYMEKVITCLKEVYYQKNSVIFVNENENGEKRESNEFVNEN